MAIEKEECVKRPVILYSVLFLSVVLLTAQTKEPAGTLFLQASAGIGSGMYIGAGAEYLVKGAADFLPINLQFGGMGNARFIPLTSQGYSGLGADVMGTVHYYPSSLPRLDLLLGTGFGLIYYTGYGDQEPTLSSSYITFAVTLAGTWALSNSLGITAGIVGYPGEFFCASAGARLKI